VVKRKKVKTKEDSFKRVNKVPMKVSKKGSKLGSSSKLYNLLKFATLANNTLASVI